MKSVGIGLVCLAIVGCRTEDKSQSHSPTPSASSVPVVEAPTAEKLVELDCLPCHDQLMLEQQRLTAKQWGAVVKKMQNWGALISADEVESLTAYLAKRYPADGPEYKVPTVSTTDVQTQFAESNESAFSNGDRKKGETLFQLSCLPCHGLHGKGTSMAIALYDRRILQHPTEFAEVVRKGRRRMIPHPGLSDADIAGLLAYLRTAPESDPPKQ